MRIAYIHFWVICYSFCVQSSQTLIMTVKISCAIYLFVNKARMVGGPYSPIAMSQIYENKISPIKISQKYENKISQL